MDYTDKQKQSVVGAAADTMRDMVFAAEAGSLIGSLQDLAKSLAVGIVTVQQAARVLEHEGLLEARRGPGGGYYGTRPNGAALERSITAYLRSNPTSYEEALNITSLLFNELVPAAARCKDTSLLSELKALLGRIDTCLTDDDCGLFENEFQDLLFRMVDWPLFKLLTLVTLRVGVTNSDGMLKGHSDAVVHWREGRKRIMSAIALGDAELAAFEANRSNRRVVMARVTGRS
jgi:GntR family transcriptional repressor for pyruvate dehydrogenase complex